MTYCSVFCFWVLWYVRRGHIKFTVFSALGNFRRTGWLHNWNVHHYTTGDVHNYTHGNVHHYTIEDIHHYTTGDVHLNSSTLHGKYPITYI